MDDELATEYESNAQKIINVQCDIRNLYTALGNINGLIIDVKESIRALDTRTSIFCPDPKSKQDNAEGLTFYRKVWHRLEKQATDISRLKERLK